MYGKSLDRAPRRPDLRSRDAAGCDSEVVRLEIRDSWNSNCKVGRALLNQLD